MRNIQSVNGFKVGHIFEHDGNLFRAIWFRSRNTVVGKLVHGFFDPAPDRVKVSLLDVNTLSDLNFEIRLRAQNDEDAFRNAGILRSFVFFWIVLSMLDELREPRHFLATLASAGAVFPAVFAFVFFASKSAPEQADAVILTSSRARPGGESPSPSPSP